MDFLENENINNYISRCLNNKDIIQGYPDFDRRIEYVVNKAVSMLNGVEAADFMFYFNEFGNEEELTEDNLYIPNESEYIHVEGEFYQEIDLSIAKPGLWDNIRKKKEREGKNYKPAKPGDKDRPDPESWKKAQSEEYQGRKVTLNKPFRTPDGPKKFSVYVKNDKGNIVKVNFGDPNMKIKKNIPERRKSFRARHHCDTNPGPKWKARYWACKAW